MIKYKYLLIILSIVLLSSYAYASDWLLIEGEKIIDNFLDYKLKTEIDIFFSKKNIELIEKMAESYAFKKGKTTCSIYDEILKKRINEVIIGSLNNKLNELACKNNLKYSKINLKFDNNLSLYGLKELLNSVEYTKEIDNIKIKLILEIQANTYKIKKNWGKAFQDKENLISSNDPFLILESDSEEIALMKLVKLNVDCNIKDTEGQSLLIYVVKNKKKKIVKYLLEKNVEVNYCDKEGMSALMYAVSEYNPDYELISLLLKYNADINIKNKFGTDSLKLLDKFCCNDQKEKLLNLLKNYKHN